MNELAKKILPFAPVVAGLLTGPGGAAVAAGLVKALGLNSADDIANLPPERLAELDTLSKQIQLAEIKSDTDIKIAQIGVNTRAAKSASLFVSGARPAVIWIGALGIGYHFIFRPLANAVSVIWMGGPLIIDGSVFEIFPPIDIAGIITITGGLLGFGAKRTVEKIKGVARNSLRD